MRCNGVIPSQGCRNDCGSPLRIYRMVGVLGEIQVTVILVVTVRVAIAVDYGPAVGVSIVLSVAV